MSRRMVKIIALATVAVFLLTSVGLIGLFVFGGR